MCYTNTFYLKNKKETDIIFEFERAVVLRFGRILPEGAIGPGLIETLKGVDVLKKKVDVREACYVIPAQRIETTDDQIVEVVGIVFMEIFDPVKSVLNVKDGNVEGFVYSHAGMLLRNAISSHSLQEILQNKQELQHVMKVYIYKRIIK